MPKLTRRAYTQQCAALDAAIDVVRAELSELTAEIETGKIAVTTEVTERGNALHDRFWDMKQDRDQLDRDWETRNWTAGDWSSWELVCNNVD